MREFLVVCEVDYEPGSYHFINAIDKEDLLKKLVEQSISGCNVWFVEITGVALSLSSEEISQEWRKQHG